MRVWHLLSNRWNSAITEYALSAARALETAGHESVLTPLAGSPAARRGAVHVDTRPVAGFGLTELGTLTRMARAVRADVVLTYGGPETFLAKALRGPKEAPVVRFRGQAVERSGFACGLRHRLAHAHVALVLTPSEALAAAVRRLAPGARVSSVTLGVDPAVFHRVPQPSWPPARPELVLLGRFDPVKGHAAMMRLFAALLQRWGDRESRPRLHVVGEPANLGVADVHGCATAAGLRLGDDVVVTAARVEDVAALLSGAALGVVPSLGSEIICRVAEEFLLCGTPVAVSGVGSLDEVLAFPEAGCSWRGLDEAAAATRLEAWLARSLAEDETEKLRRAAEAEERFSLAAMGQALTTALQI